jgi:hypothetical protein
MTSYLDVGHKEQQCVVTVKAGRNGMPCAILGVQGPGVPGRQRITIPGEGLPPHIQRQRLRAVVKHYQNLRSVQQHVNMTTNAQGKAAA